MGNQMTLGAVPFARPRARTNDVLRYELNVLGSGAAEVVAGVGGWLFDRRMAGWHVGVALTDCHDDTGLRILGLKPVDPKHLWRSAEGNPEAVVMTAIATDRFDSDDEVRLRALEAVHNGAGEVAFWGADCPVQLSAGLHRVPYQLSAAARVFKAHALAAFGMSAESADPVEAVFSGGSGTGVLHTDLTPVC